MNITADVLERAEIFNVKFNINKFKFALPKIKYLGHVFSKEGVHADENKIKAITDMKEPKDKTAVKRFLGMITYLGSFLKNVSEKTAPLRDSIFKKNAQWQCESNYRLAFENLKKQLTSIPVLICTF